MLMMVFLHAKLNFFYQNIVKSYTFSFFSWDHVTWEDSGASEERQDQDDQQQQTVDLLGVWLD